LLLRLIFWRIHTSHQYTVFPRYTLDAFLSDAAPAFAVSNRATYNLFRDRFTLLCDVIDTVHLGRIIITVSKFLAIPKLRFWHARRVYEYDYDFINDNLSGPGAAIDPVCVCVCLRPDNKFWTKDIWPRYLFAGSYWHKIQFVGVRTFRPTDSSPYGRFAPYMDILSHGRFAPWMFRLALDINGYKSSRSVLSSLYATHQSICNHLKLLCDHKSLNTALSRQPELTRIHQ